MLKNIWTTGKFLQVIRYEIHLYIELHLYIGQQDGLKCLHSGDIWLGCNAFRWLKDKLTLDNSIVQQFLDHKDICANYKSLKSLKLTCTLVDMILYNLLDWTDNPGGCITIVEQVINYIRGDLIY